MTVTLPTVTNVVCTTCDAMPPTVVVTSDRYPVASAPAGVDPEALSRAFQANCWCQSCARQWAQVFTSA